MAAKVLIDGAEVDADNPCAVAASLRAVALKVASGGSVVVSRFDDDEVRWSAVNLNALRELISDYERRCEAGSGRRYRYAKRMRFMR